MDHVFVVSDIYDAVIPPYRRPSLMGRAFRRWFPNWWRPPANVMVFEHADGDWDTAHCIGDPTRAWRVTPDGPVDIDTTTAIDTSSVGPWYRDSSVFRFCISPDGKRLIYSRLNGPRAGIGAVYDIRLVDGRPKLVNPQCRWRA